MSYIPTLKLAVLLGVFSVVQYPLADEFIFLNPAEVNELTEEIQSLLTKNGCKIPN